MTNLGGWWRLWIVCSILIGAVIFASTFDPTPKSLNFSEAVPAGKKVDYDKWRDEKLHGRTCLNSMDYPIHLVPKNDPEGPGTLILWCEPVPNLKEALLWSLVPGLSLLALGLTFSWVRAGFRTRPQETDRSREATERER